MKYKNFEIPDNAIDNLMDNLDISLADACELWLADNGKIKNEEQTALDKNRMPAGLRPLLTGQNSLRVGTMSLQKSVNPPKKSVKSIKIRQKYSV